MKYTSGKFVQYDPNIHANVLEIYTMGSLHSDDNMESFGYILSDIPKEIVNEFPENYYVKVDTNLQVEKGGPGSGHYGHSGRPGLVGGSSSDDFQPGTVPAHEEYYSPDDWDVKPRSGVFGLSDWNIPFQESYNLHILLSDNIESEKTHHSKSTTVIEDGEPKLKLVRMDQEKFDANMKYLKWKYASQDAMEKTKDEIVNQISKDSGVEYRMVNKIIAQWAHSSNDNDYRSLSLQEAAAEEFGLEMSEWQKETLERFKPHFKLEKEHAKLMGQHDKLYEAMLDNKVSPSKYKELSSPLFERMNEITAIFHHVGMQVQQLRPLAPRDVERKVLRAIYENTQKRLKEFGFKKGDKVTLFRGMRDVGDSIYAGIFKGDIANYIGNVVESWSASYLVGQMFGDFVVSMSVPIENIFSTARTGMGCLNEGEVITFGNIPGSQVILLSEDES